MPCLLFLRPTLCFHNVCCCFGSVIAGTDIARELASSRRFAAVYISEKDLTADQQAQCAPGTIRVSTILELEESGHAICKFPRTIKASAKQGSPKKCVELPGSVPDPPTAQRISVDHVVLCTGYEYSFPFLHSLQASTNAASSPFSLAPVLDSPSSSHAIGSPGAAPHCDGFAVRDLHQQVFFNENPSLVFLGLPYNVVPWPMAQLQVCPHAHTHTSVSIAQSTQKVQG